MLVKLKNYYLFEHIVVNIDLETNISCNDHPVNDSAIGLYAMLGKDRVGFALLNKNFYILWNDFVLPLDSGVEVFHNTQDLARELKIVFQSHIFECFYTVKDPVSTPFFSEDDQDSDFGLWLYSVTHTPLRLNDIKEQWANGL